MLAPIGRRSGQITEKILRDILVWLRTGFDLAEINLILRHTESVFSIPMPFYFLMFNFKRFSNIIVHNRYHEF